VAVNLGGMFDEKRISAITLGSRPPSPPPSTTYWMPPPPAILPTLHVVQASYRSFLEVLSGHDFKGHSVCRWQRLPHDNAEGSVPPAL